MPWTVADVDRFKKGLSPQQKRQWVRVANGALARCKSEGGSNCDAAAIRQANGVVGHQDMEQFTYSNENYTVRERQHQGTRHLIVPVIMMVEGVHHGSHGAYLHMAEDLGHFPDAWNGIPVVVGHPQVDGHNVSANSPDIIDEIMVGRVFNTYIEDGKLKGEVWLNEEKLREISSEVLDYIHQQRPLEVSIGAFTDAEETGGQWNDEQYEAIARNHRPDHLALLPGGTGACSWDDGCGIRAAERFEPPEAGNAPAELKSILNRVYNDCRNRWVTAHPSDKENAANKTSCARIAWHAVRQAGYRKSGDRWVMSHQNKEGGKSVEKKSTQIMDGEDLLDIRKDLSSAGLSINSFNQVNEQGFKTLINTIQVKLDGMDTSERVHFLQDVYEDYFVYEIRKRTGGSNLYKRSYQVTDNDEVEFTGEPTEVRRQVDYINLRQGFKRTKFNNNSKKVEETIMSNEKKPCCEDLVNELIASERTKWEESDREYLMSLEENTLAKFVPNEQKPDDEPKKEPQANADDTETEGKETKKTIEDYLGEMPEEMQDHVKSGLTLHREQRAKMIKSILDNTEKGTWTEDELNTMSTDVLKKISKSVVSEEEEIHDYSGLSTATTSGEVKADDALYSIEVLEAQKVKKDEK